MKIILIFATLITEICSTTHSFSNFKDKATKGCGQISTDFCHKHVPCGSRLFNMELLAYSKKYGSQKFIIDDEDYDLISGQKWWAACTRGKWYVVGYGPVNGVVKRFYLHRLLMGVLDTPQIHIDHRDNDGMNNRKNNLRKATIAENSRNVGCNKMSKSKLKGVSIYSVGKMAGMYAVRLRFNGKKVFGGYFKDPIEAAKKYNEMALKYHGEFAYQNIIRI